MWKGVFEDNANLLKNIDFLNFTTLITYILEVIIYLLIFKFLAQIFLEIFWWNTIFQKCFCKEIL